VLAITICSFGWGMAAPSFAVSSTPA